MSNLVVGQLYYQQGRLFTYTGPEMISEGVIATSEVAERRFVATGRTKGCYSQKITHLPSGEGLDWYEGAPKPAFADGEYVKIDGRILIKYAEKYIDGRWQSVPDGPMKI